MVTKYARACKERCKKEVKISKTVRLTSSPHSKPLPTPLVSAPFTFGPLSLHPLSLQLRPSCQSAQGTPALPENLESNKRGSQVD